MLTGTRGVQPPLDDGGGLLHRDVLPDSDDTPTRGLESGVRRPIPFHVASELGRPVPLVPGRLASMLGTYVPEAPVHEHRDPAPWEDKIRSHPSTWEIHAQVFPEPSPSAV